MKRWIVLCIAGLFLASRAAAQIAPPPIAPPQPVFVPAPPPPTTLWSFLGISCDRWHECKQRCCQRLRPGDLSLAEEAAAKIRCEEAGAKSRRAAVRYLGTVDCHYYPEAEVALIAALRADPNECVRLEAARALGNGCCCTKATVAALNIVVSGGDEDHNPAETSVRVKICALEALEHCLGRCGDMAPRLPPEWPAPLPAKAPREVGRAAKDERVKLASYAAPAGLGGPVPADGATDATRVYAEHVGALPRPTLPAGSRSLFDIVAFSRQRTAVPTVAPATPPLAAPLPALRPSQPLPAPRGPDALTPIGVVPQ